MVGSQACCWLSATVLGMVAAEPFTTSSTLVVSTADTTTEPTAEFVEVLVEGLIDELIGALVACVILNGSDGVRAVRDGRKTRDGYCDEYSRCTRVLHIRRCCKNI